jgi:tRNA nucleotidyltransferase/poly(A) polymerase
VSATPLRLEADWLRHGALAALLALLDRDGEEARVIGGAVRNTFLAEPPGDIDIATTATPEVVTARAEAAGFKAVPTGIDHGTVTVVVEGRPHEVTTLREDVETYGRHARVVFGRDWRRDAQRRDFTMNALSVARDGTLFDYVGGLDDLTARRVRFIGEPQQRIAEDYLRILRFFRFHAAYGEGAPDAAALAACIAARRALDTLSRERVRTEMLKLLVARNAAPVLTVMSESGLLLCVLAGVTLPVGLRRMTEIEASLALAPDAIRRLGALALFTVEDAERLRERLRLANAEHERLLAMADRWWHISVDTAEQDGRAALYRLGRTHFTDRVCLAWSRAGLGIIDPRWHELARLPERWSAPDFPLTAADMMARGVEKGPALVAALRAAEEVWIAADFPIDAADIAAIADAAARRALTK